MRALSAPETAKHHKYRGNGPALLTSRSILLTQGNSERGATGARVGVLVVRVLVRLGAVGVTRLAGDTLAAAAIRLGREAALDEGRVLVEVDAGEVPEDLVSLAGVLELEDGLLGAAGGHLDGDTAAVGGGLHRLGCAVTAGAEALRSAGARCGGGVLDLNLLRKVVDDGDAAAAAAAARGRAGAGAAGGGAGGARGSRGSGGCESEGGSEEGLGEIHSECIGLVWFGL